MKDLIGYCRQKGGVLSGYIVSREAEIMGLYEEMWTREGNIEAREKEIRRISLEEGRAEGLAEGLAEGKAEMSRDIAIAMLKDNEPIEKIMKYSGLTEDEVLSIKNAI